MALSVLCSLYCGFFMTTAVPFSDICSKVISSSDKGVSKLSSFMYLERINPDFSPFEMVLIRTFSETDSAASFPTPFLPIFFRFNEVSAS